LVRLLAGCGEHPAPRQQGHSSTSGTDQAAIGFNHLGANPGGVGRRAWPARLTVSSNRGHAWAVWCFFVKKETWESRSSVVGGSVGFVFYATDDQAQEILAEVSAQDLGEVRLFTSTVEDGQPIDGSTVIEPGRGGPDCDEPRYALTSAGAPDRSDSSACCGGVFVAIA
jgi:hypothetical protein